MTSLKAGTYVCEEISAPDGYVITDAAETVYLSGKDQDVITVTFGNEMCIRDRVYTAVFSSVGNAAVKTGHSSFNLSLIHISEIF